MPEVTVFTKSGGPLTKRISLNADGTLNSDGNACVMSAGEARRYQIVDLGELSLLIQRLQPHQAIALGAMRPGLPDTVHVVTKQKLNGAANVIARTGANFRYQDGCEALVLLDYDTKGMPADVAERIERHGGFWPTLVSVLPALGGAAHITRRSTSAALFHSDTRERLPGSNGEHAYVMAQDGADCERFLTTLHERCWLAGLGWLMVGAGGQLLERSIIDRMVGAPERLVFEGGPLLVPPVAQDRESRRPVAIDGAALDTLAACRPLSIVERARVRQLREKQAHQLAAESAKARVDIIARQSKALVERTGMSVKAAARTISRQCDGVLHPGLVLPFDDEELAGTTVAEVLADPARFEGATLADPLEGVAYGRCCARIMRRADGSPWIHSFAHGRTIYELKHDVGAARTILMQAGEDDALTAFIDLALGADLNDAEIEALRNLTAERTHTTKSAIAAALRTARKRQAKEQAARERKRQFAERTDPRPLLESPASDAPWLPQMATINTAVSTTSAARPRLRDIENEAARTHEIAVPHTHAFASANPEED